MEGKRFRKARDIYKLLCKQDREKYLPGLIAANRGLAEQLIEKGQVSEAEQVLVYLKSIAPPSELLGIDLQAAQRAQDWPRAFRLALEVWKAKASGLGLQDRITVADALVLAFPNFEESSAPAVPEPLKTELQAILAALRSISERRFEDAQALLRPLPRASLFADWKLLAKAWIAFYSGDRAKSADLFALLPSASVPGQAAAAFRPFLAPEPLPSGRDREAAIRRTCEIAGEPALGPILARADQLWAAGKCIESFLEMRRWAPFPSEEADLAGVLSDFYLRASLTMPGEPVTRYVRGMLHFVTGGASGRPLKASVLKGPVEQRLICLSLGLDALENDAPEPAERYWGEFLEACPPEDPATGRMASLLCARLGHWWSQPEDLDPFGFGFGFFARHATMRNARQAMRLLKESVQRDPGNLAAHLDLVKVYEDQKKKSERNRLLDEMVKRFPGEKAVWFQMGRQCIERKAYQKGLDALEQAHALDRLDPAILKELARGYLELGRQQYEKGNAAKGRKTFERLEKHAHRNAFDFDRGLDTIRAQQAVLEMLFGDEPTGLQLFESARSATRALSPLLFFTHAFYRICKRLTSHETPFWQELQSTKIETPAHRMLLWQALEYAEAAAPRLRWKSENTFIHKCLEIVAGVAFTREEASALYPLLEKKPSFRDLARRLLKAGLQHDPEDPRFLLYAEWERRHVGSLNHRKIEALRDAAARRGDETAVKIATELLKSVPPPFFDDEDDYDDSLGGIGDEGDAPPPRRPSVRMP